MEKLYARALWRSVENGRSPSEAVAGLVEVLKKQGRFDLFVHIQRAFVRLAEEKRNIRPRIFIAREKDAKYAFKTSGVEDADVCVDESLIGGWRLEASEDLVDRSFKKYLLDIFTSSIEA